MSSDWSCKVNNKGKLRSACVFTHPRRADYNKVTPQNLHRAKCARTLNGLDSATQTGNVPLLMEQTDTEPKWLCLIVSSNCSWFADWHCSVQSHTQLSLCQALCVRGERVLFPRSGLNWGHTLMSCWLPWLHILWSQAKVSESSLAWWGCLRNISWYLRIIWKMAKVKGRCYVTPSEHQGVTDYLSSFLIPASFPPVCDVFVQSGCLVPSSVSWILGCF